MNNFLVKRSGFLSIVLAAVLFFILSFHISAAFSYVHDPMLNPKAAQDILVNPDAIYGYSPNPESQRLGEYAMYDWSDGELVEGARAEREAYLSQFQGIYALIEEMKSEGKSLEEIARAASTLRNEIRMAAYKDNPEGLEVMKRSNLETYGNENGPTPEFLYAKYGSWEGVLSGATSSNPGMDACLGLYDKYYATYGLDDTVPPDPTEQEVGPSEEQNRPDPVVPASSEEKPSVPKTGDLENVLFWIGLAAAGVVSAGTAAAVKKKIRRNRIPDSINNQTE